jgi:hypothetical protein
MMRKFHFVVTALWGLLFCMPMSAQRGGSRGFANSNAARLPQRANLRPVTRARSRWVTQAAFTTQPPSPDTAVTTAPNWQQIPGGQPFVNAVIIRGENGVPGLGFDYPHLAAISGNFPFNSSIVPNSSFSPIFFTGNTEFDGTPGLGFDYPHLAAISGNFQFNHPFDHNGIGINDNSFTPLFFSDSPNLSDYIDPSLIQQIQQQYQQQGQPQPQIIIVQQPAPAVAAAQPARPGLQDLDNSASSSATPTSSSPAPTSPIRDVGEFVFVRRDGRILFASVFSINGGQLQYVTPEGVRQTIRVADLDADATRQMNEALGSKVEISK